jgi:hypothetical protein
LFNLIKFPKNCFNKDFNYYYSINYFINFKAKTVINFIIKFRDFKINFKHYYYYNLTNYFMFLIIMYSYFSFIYFNHLFIKNLITFHSIKDFIFIIINYLLNQT